mgnify:CR=1 FL=1
MEMLSKNEMLGAINAVRVHNSEKVIDFERSEITTNIEYIDDENLNKFTEYFGSKDAIINFK